MKIINQGLVLDGIDKQIIDHLIENTRIPILKIARNIGVSGAPVHRRFHKIKELVMISESHIKINLERLGNTTKSFIGIFLDKATHNSEAVAMLEEIQEVTSCYYTTGNWSLLIQMNCKDNNHL